MSRKNNMNYTISRRLKNGSFNIALATEMGMEKAYLLQEVMYWLEANQYKQDHIKEGLVWTYGSYDYWHEKYPYIARRAIELHFSGLVKEGWLASKELSAKEGNRQKWYTAGPKAAEFFYDAPPSRKNEGMVPQDPPPIPQKRGDGPAETQSSVRAFCLALPVSSTESIPPTPKGECEKTGEGDKPKQERPLTEEQLIYKAYPRHQAPQAAFKAITKALRLKGFTDLMEATRAYRKATERWPEDDRRFIPHPASWFNAGGYDDDRDTWVRGSSDSVSRLREF